MKPLLTSVLLLLAATCNAASFRTANFIVTAPTTDQAQRVALDAERHRASLATSWLGQNLPDWGGKCAVNVSLRNSAGGGATSFAFANNRPVGIQMHLEGSWQSIIDDVLPHEVMHTVFATRFGRPLPRWLDEGAASTVESASYQTESRQRLQWFLTRQPSRGIPFNRMFAMTEYPHDVMPLYDQGRSVVQFLINHKGDITTGRRAFIAYVADGLNAGSNRNAWTNATRKHYGYANLSQLQTAWVRWVSASMQGQPITARQYQLSGCRCVNCPCANCTCGPGCRIATGIRNGVRQIVQPLTPPPPVVPQSVPVAPPIATPVQPVETAPAQVTITTPVQTVVGPPGPQGPPGTVDPEQLARLVAQAVAALPPAPAGPPGPRGADATVDYDALLERMAADGRFRGADGAKGDHGDSFTAQEAQAMIEAAVLRLARGAEGQAFIEQQISAYMARNPATSTGLTQADLMALASNPQFVAALVKALPAIPVATYGRDGTRVDYEVYPFGTTIKILDTNR